MSKDAAAIFTNEWARQVFPPERTDEFFEALFGGAEEGAYDIGLRFVGVNADIYEFAFDLRQREGKCLVCNLTYGLPQVFARHPVLNLKGVAEGVAQALGRDASKVSWKLQATRELSAVLHSIPFLVSVQQ